MLPGGNGWHLSRKIVAGQADVAIPPYCSGQFRDLGPVSALAAFQLVAIPPYCSGQFRDDRADQRTAPGGDPHVAIPPYCSGQFRALFSADAALINAVKSQSHRTAQGNSEKRCYGWVTRRLSRSQSHRTVQGNSEGEIASCLDENFNMSQSHRTAQGNSEAVAQRVRHAGARDVAIPPYCSGQFRELTERSADGAEPAASQSHRTAQGNSELMVDDANLTKAILSQSHRTAQGNSESDVMREWSGSAASEESQSHRTAQGNSEHTLSRPR